MKKLSALLCSILILVACDTNESATPDNHDYMDDNLRQENAATPVAFANTKNDGGEISETANEEIDLSKSRKLIWNANMRCQVSNVDSSTQVVQELCEKYDGFISNMELSANAYQLSNFIEIRIANNKFHKLISSFKAEATYVDELKVKSDDVTEEFVDIESRLNTKRDVRDRYIEVLRNKAGTVKDIIAAEEAIRVITEEIEVIEGRLRYLKDRINFSTITLSIYQKVEFSEKPSVYDKPYSSELAEGFNNGWSIVTDFFLVLVTLWPVLLLTILALWKGRWFLRLFSRKTTEKTK